MPTITRQVSTHHQKGTTPRRPFCSPVRLSDTEPLLSAILGVLGKLEEKAKLGPGSVASRNMHREKRCAYLGMTHDGSGHTGGRARFVTQVCEGCEAFDRGSLPHCTPNQPSQTSQQGLQRLE